MPTTRIAAVPIRWPVRIDIAGTAPASTFVRGEAACWQNAVKQAGIKVE